MENNKNKIYVVDDDAAVRDSLATLLLSEDLDPVPFENPTEFLDKLSVLPDGIILLDLCMPGMTGIEVIEELNSRGVTMPVICITGHGDVTTAVKALKLGASDFMEKPFDSTQLIDRVIQCIDEQASQKQIEDFTCNAKKMVSKLTPREKEVLDGLVAGDRNKQIAYNLGISIRTVELHRAHVLEKLEAKSLSDVVKISIAADIDNMRTS